MVFDSDLPRCRWPGASESGSPLIACHDTERGVPVHDERRHFEFPVPAACPAGLEIDHVTGCLRHVPLRGPSP